MRFIITLAQLFHGASDVDVYEGDYGEGESPDEPKFTATMGYGSG